MVQNEVVKKTVYDKLVAKVNNIWTSGFVLKTKYDTDKPDLEKEISDADKKIPDAVGLVKKTYYNPKTTEIESKIPSISDLATNSALTAAEDKIPDASNLVKKKQIMMQKQLILKIMILLQLITINLLKILLIIA